MRKRIPKKHARLMASQPGVPNLGFCIKAMRLSYLALGNEAREPIVKNGIAKQNGGNKKSLRHRYVEANQTILSICGYRIEFSSVDHLKEMVFYNLWLWAHERISSRQLIRIALDVILV